MKIELPRRPARLCMFSRSASVTFPRRAKTSLGASVMSPTDWYAESAFFAASADAKKPSLCAGERDAIEMLRRLLRRVRPKGSHRVEPGQASWGGAEAPPRE